MSSSTISSIAAHPFEEAMSMSSLCWVPPRISLKRNYKSGLCNVQKKSIVVVVAPLVASMADQVHSLRAKGVNAVILSS